MKKQKRPRKISICVQFDNYQVENLDAIIELQNSPSYSETVRKAWDFYVEKNYPNLI